MLERVEGWLSGGGLTGFAELKVACAGHSMGSLVALEMAAGGPTSHQLALERGRPCR